MEKGEGTMTEPESLRRVWHEMQNFQRDFPKMAKEISDILGQVRILGMATTHDEEDRIRFRMKKNNLGGTVSSMQAAMVSLGYTAKSALEEGDLSPQEREFCELLYEVFVPERSTLS